MLPAIAYGQVNLDRSHEMFVIPYVKSTADTGPLQGSEHTDPDVRTSEQAIAALKKWHVIEVSARLQDTPERDWYHCGSAGESGSETGE